MPQNKVLRGWGKGEKENWHGEEQSLFPTLTERMGEIRKGWDLKKK